MLVAGAPASPTSGAGAPLPGNPFKFVQREGKTVIDDRLTANEVDILGGRLGGHGFIDAEKVVIGAGGTLAPGNSPGILTIGGNLFITGVSLADDPVRIMGGVLEIEIAGTDNSGEKAQFDQVHVGGNAYFAEGSSITFIFYPIYTPKSGDTWEFLTSAGLDGMSNLTYNALGLAADFGYEVFALGSDLYLRVYSRYQDQNAAGPGQSAVPEPSTGALHVLAFMLLAAWCGRTRRLAVARRARLN